VINRCQQADEANDTHCMSDDNYYFYDDEGQSSQTIAAFCSTASTFRNSGRNNVGELMPEFA
jgi:hypothetical protein